MGVRGEALPRPCDESSGLGVRHRPANPDCVWTCAEINFDSVQTPHYPNEMCQPRDWARSPMRTKQEQNRNAGTHQTGQLLRFRGRFRWSSK